MSTILVTGATGTIGSTLANLLSGRPEVKVRVLVRDPHRGREHLHNRIEFSLGDFADASSVDAAVEGVDTVFLACGNVREQVAYECAMIDAAARSGVRRIVKLSARGAEIDAPVAYWHWHGMIEQHLQASGVPSVVLRPGFVMTNLLGSAQQVRQLGMLFAPVGDSRIAMIDPSDVAAVAAVALTDDGHEGRTYTLTGPAAISYRQVAAELSAAAGQPVRFADIRPRRPRRRWSTVGCRPLSSSSSSACSRRCGTVSRPRPPTPFGS